MKKTLNGSSVIEVVVASVLFLLMFLIAMGTLSRAGMVPHQGTMLQAESDFKACVTDFETGVFTAGEYEMEYSWGNIFVSVSPYKSLPDIQDVSFKMYISSGRRTVKYRILKQSPL